MICISRKEECCGCYGCVQVCPMKCVSMIEDKEGFFYPQVETLKCINCGLCEKICPIKKNNGSKETRRIVLAGYSKDDNIRQNSSSGGIISHILENWIKNQGIVYGVILNDNLEVVHDRINCIDDLYKLRGSKYVESKINHIYLRIKEDLENDNKVLFVGTPCQVVGLKNFLEKDVENLCTIDFICHGVPSSKVWEMNKKNRGKKENNELKRVDFRNKINGWREFHIRYEYEQGEEYLYHQDDLYMKLFLNNIILRPSCYECKFREMDRVSDITVGDFWGVEKYMKDDDGGMSLIVVHSTKGDCLIEDIKNKLVLKKVNDKLEEIIKKDIEKNISVPRERSSFFGDIDDLRYDVLVNKYCKMNYQQKIIRLLKSIGMYKLVKSIYLVIFKAFNKEIRLE